MGENAKHHQNPAAAHRQQSQKHKTSVVGKLLIAVFAIQIFGLFLPPQAHRIGGILFVALLLIHLLQHRKWITSLFKGRYTTKRKQITAINLGLFACLTGMIVSGFSMLGSTRRLLMTLHFGTTEILHVLLMAITLILIVAHVAPLHKRLHNTAKR